jgi:hypothetical protein
MTADVRILETTPLKGEGILEDCAKAGEIHMEENRHMA